MAFRYGGSDWQDQWWPGRMFDQHFGMALSEPDRLMRETAMLPYHMRPGRMEGASTGTSEVLNDDNQFAVNLDVSHFAPNELKVNVVDDKLTVEAKHAERTDPHGFIQRAFTRKYVLPKEVDPQALSSHLSNNGVLTISAPKLALEQKPNERTIPIAFASGHHGGQRAIHQGPAASVQGKRPSEDKPAE